MKHTKLLVASALLLGLVPALYAQGTPRPAKPILLHVQVFQLPESKLKEVNGGKTPPKVFVVPAAPKENAANLLKLGAKILAEPSLGTTDGCTASFQSGGEIPALGIIEDASQVDWLSFGTKLEVVPRILADGRISFKFRFEQTARAEDPARDAAITALSGAVLTSGLVSEGIATLKEGESVFATVPFAQSDSKENGGDVLLMFFTPEIVQDVPNVQPASATAPPKPPALSEVEIQTQVAQASKLQGDRRAALVLEVSETGYLESPENIRSVKVTSGRKGIATVTAEGNQRLLVQAKQVGDVMLVATDNNGDQYEALIQVNPATGTDAVQDTLSRLFPDAQIEVTAINESLLLRGSVIKEEHLKQIADIAEQYAPKILNHLVVDDGLSPANQFELPPGMRFQSVRAILLEEADVKNDGETESRYVEANVEMEWTELVEGKAIRSFKPLLSRVAVVSAERENNNPYGPTGYPDPESEVKKPDENALAQVVLVVTPDQAGILKLSGRSSRLRVRLVKPGVGPFPVGQLNRDTERLLRGTLATTDPVPFETMGRPENSRFPRPDEKSEFQELRNDVKALRQDVKRLIELLEHKAAAKPNTSSDPYGVDPAPVYYPAPMPTAPIAPILPSAPPTPLPSGTSFDPYTLPNPAYLPAPLPSATPNREPQPSVELLPNHTGPNPVKALPNHTGPNPVIPVPKDQAGWSDPILPTRLPNPKEPAADPLLQPATEAAQDRVETKPVPDSLDPSAFVTVRSVKISAPNELLENASAESLGSGVVIESEPGKAVILTAAHLLKDYEAGKYVLQVTAVQRIEGQGKTPTSGVYPATIILQDDNADIALLRAKVPMKLGTISLARHSLPKPQDRVHCIGFPSGGNRLTRLPRSIPLKVTEVNRSKGRENFQFDGLLFPGFSGAAVLDESFQLIGIVSSMNIHDIATVCSPAAEIRKLLAKNQIPEATDPKEPLGPNLAAEVFGPESWVAKAKWHIRLEHADLYFNEWSPSDRDKTCQFKPFAAIPIPNDEAADTKPRGFLCDSATLQFPVPFRFAQPGSFNPKSGTLEGVVRGTTDNGLKVIGEDLEYAEVARHWQASDKME